LIAILLYCTTALIGFCWILAQRKAAAHEFEEPRQRRSWTTASTLLFLVILSFTLTAGSSGWLADFSKLPPPFAGFFLFIWVAAFYCGCSQFGTALVKHTPMHYLIIFHMFRFFAELILLLAWKEGLAPKALTLEGYNYDIVIAATAIPTAWIAKRNPSSKIIWAWSVLGFLSLLNIAFIAATSMPTPLRLFMEEPSNVWVTGLPYILLPGVLVTAAITGHLIVFRKLVQLKG
jgi:hypothetical protein